MFRRLMKLPNSLAANGVMNVLAYFWKAFILDRLYRWQRSSEAYRVDSLHTNQLAYPVKCRYGSSDFRVFRQIFLADQYRPVQLSKDIKLVVDCGAYIGYSTAYFLTKCPDAHVIAIEPDGRNFELLRQNLEAYAGRITLFHAAIWSHQTRLKVIRNDYGEWSTQVVECKENEQGDLDALDIPALLGACGYSTIDAMKIDIEGAEGVLFSRNYEAWIDRVNTFVIELHSDCNKEIFLRALNGRGFDISTSGELTIARRNNT